MRLVLIFNKSFVRSIWNNKVGSINAVQTTMSICLIMLFTYEPSYTQQIVTLQASHPNDSSYYHLARIDENEYWACGEMGIITRFDSLGNFQSMPIQTDGYNILKVERFGDVVIIATDDARIMKYNLISGQLTKVDFKRYKNRCFYDFSILPDGKIILCGGTTGIAKGYKKIPNGFIAVTDTALTPPQKVWRSKRKFVWSLLTEKDGKIIASVFNGMNSRLLISNEWRRWKKGKRMKGLIHEIKRVDATGTISYVGTGSMHYERTGVFSLDGQHPGIVDSSGCIWSQERTTSYQVLSAQNGQLLLFNQHQLRATIVAPSRVALYDLKFINPHKILVVGHGKCAYLVQLP